MTISAPLELYRDTIRPEWVDYNGHMNVAYYVLVFDFATDALQDFVGLDAAHRDAAAGSTFVAESHVNYLRELMEGDPVRITTQLLGVDKKRFHFFHRMYHATDGYLAATSEWLNLYVDLRERRVASMPEALLRRFREVEAAHRELPWPEQAGRAIRLTSKQAT